MSSEMFGCMEVYGHDVSAIKNLKSDFVQSSHALFILWQFKVKWLRNNGNMEEERGRQEMKEVISSTLYFCFTFYFCCFLSHYVLYFNVGGLLHFMFILCYVFFEFKCCTFTDGFSTRNKKR